MKYEVTEKNKPKQSNKHATEKEQLKTAKYRKPALETSTSLLVWMLIKRHKFFIVTNVLLLENVVWFVRHFG
jgi:hypothetical protein